MKLLGIPNAKTIKGEKRGYLTGIMYMHPHVLDGKNVCPYATAGCAAACLNTAGRGRMDPIQEARKRKTRWFFESKKTFIDQLAKDIATLERRAKRRGMTPVVRLNGTSDIAWERVAGRLFDDFPHIQFYDYTKAPHRAGRLKDNYHVTFSMHEEVDSETFSEAIGRGNVAVVFRGGIPETFRGYPVISGDDDDLRFLDPEKGHVIGLKAKGDAIKDTTGFVFDCE